MGRERRKGGGRRGGRAIKNDSKEQAREQRVEWVGLGEIWKELGEEAMIRIHGIKYSIFNSKLTLKPGQWGSLILR